MRFNVEVADAKTGAERIVQVEANDERHAETIVRAQGLLVSAVLPSTTSAPPIDYQQPRRTALVHPPASAYHRFAPAYFGLVLAGFALRILSALGLAIGLLFLAIAVLAALRSGSPLDAMAMLRDALLAALAPLAFGAIMYGIGEGCFALRDIAINSYRH